MKRSLILLVVILHLLAGQACAQSYKVAKVIDGATLKLSDGKIVKLIGIDAPPTEENKRARLFAEMSGKPLPEVLKVGRQSQEFVKGLTEGRDIRLEFDTKPQDAQGRLYAYVFLTEKYDGAKRQTVPPGYVLKGDEVFVNATIIGSGFAKPLNLAPNTVYSAFFNELFAQAKANKFGLWQ